MHRYIAAFAGLTLVLLTEVAVAANAPPAMIAPGQFNVSATGAATYTMPIAVPPGSAGMVPALSLDYSSQGGDGIGGIGWTLSGLPSISRCPRTFAQDSIHGSVNYDSNDRFCMEGQRLILISGTYGADGSEYRMEIESFSRIIAHGSAGSGPAWFEVHTKSGQVMQFGNTIDSRILVVNAINGVIATARAWAVNMISDTVGNYLAVTYNCTPVAGACTDTDRTIHGEAYPLEIDYTGNASAGVNPYNSVKFVYSNRTDALPLYQAGGITQTTVVLTDIETYQGTNLVYDYRLTYRAGTSTVHSRLTSLTLCDGSGSCAIPCSASSHCLATTTFGWQGGTGQMTMTGTANSAAFGQQAVPGDFNGDGITDVLPLTIGGFYCPVNFPIYNGPGFTTTTSSFPDPFWGISVGCEIKQLPQTIIAPNGASNLLLALSATTGHGYYTYLNIFNTTGPLSSASFYAGTVNSVPLALAGDFNGDGITDVFLQGMPSTIWLGNSSGAFPTSTSGGSFNPSTTAVIGADFDGDGCIDVLALGPTNQIAYSCNPAVSTGSPPAVPRGYHVTLGDFNGDGKTDILLTGSGPGQLWLAAGTGFVEVNSSLPSGWGSYVISIGDWNGDGKADLLLVISSTSSTTHDLLYVSTGTGFTPALDTSNNPITVTNGLSTVSADVADWNSDGASDFWLHQPGGDTIYTFAYIPELMTSVSNGLGSTATISYAPLNTNGTLYTKGSSATFPTQDIDGALYVVSRVDASDGLGLCSPPTMTYCYSSTYSYAGAQINLQGRGFLGFSQVVITDLQTNVVQTTNYSTTFPYIGLITSQTKTHSTTTLNSTTNTLANNSGCSVTPATGVYVVCLTESVVASHDLDGTAMPTVTTDYTYDSYGNALTVNVSVSDGSSKDTTNTFSNDTTHWFLGRLATTTVNSIVGSSNLTRHSSFSYDAPSGLLTQEVVESGVSTCNSGSSSCTVTTTYTYDSFGHRTSSQVSGSGITTRTSYASWDSNGEFQASATNALGQSESWAYDARFGQPANHTGPNGLTTTWTYDSFGRGLLETRPDGTQAAQSYAYCSGIAGGTASCPTYGAYLATAQIFAPDGTTQIGPTGTAYYDMLSRGIASDTQGYDGSDIRLATQYDGNGRVQQTSRPYFTSAPPCPSSSPCWTSFIYDDLGRVTQATFPDSSIKTYAFSGLTTSVTNNLSQTTTTVKDARGLTASVTDPASHTTSYVYDAFGDALTVTDPAGNVVTNTYDIRGRKITSSDPDMGGWSYVYDVLGELTSQIDAKSQTTTLTYDLLGRVLSRAETNLYSTWTYGTSPSSHNVGQLAEAEACTASGCSTLVSDRTFTYDSLGRPSATVLRTPADHFGYYTSYNATNGKIDTVQYPSEFVEKSLYNAYGYLCRLTDNGGSHTCTDTADSHVLWTANTRDAEFHLTQSTAGSGVVTNQSFDPNTGLPTCTYTGSTCTAAGTTASLGYSFDTIGNLNTRTDSNESYTEHFCYDSLNRLTNYAIGSACTSSGTKTVAYDSIGNITEKTDLCSTSGCYAYPTSGSSSVQPHAVSSITGTVNGVINPYYTYDGNGNLTCTSTASGCTGTMAQTVTMTSFNMASVVAQGSTSVGFTYDSEHARIRQVSIVSGTTTTTDYLNDPASGGMSQRVQVGSSAPSFTDFLAVDGKIVAQRTASLTAPQWGFATWNSYSWTAAAVSVSYQYFVLDHLGSVAVVTDASGMVLQRLSYDAWGKARNPDGTDAACGSITSPTTRGFTNQEQIDALCLINLNARLYDSTIGKFLAPDPVIGDPGVPNAFNRYDYVLNNPLSFTDPTGLCFLGCFWTSPIFGAILDIGLIAIGLPELEIATGAVAAPAAGVSAYAAASAAGFTVVNGVVAGALTAGVTGGNVLKGALFGGLSAGLASYAGPVLGRALGGTLAEAGIGADTASIAGNFIAQGAVGGIVSVTEGGNFGSGFLAAGFGSFAGPLGLQGGSFNTSDLIESAALGGIGSVLGGGKFANGAVTGAFSYAAGASYGNGNGTGAANDNNPFNGLLDLAGKIWNLPNTVIGIGFGGIGYLTGEIMGTNPDIKFGYNALDFLRNPLAGTGITFGNAINLWYDPTETAGEGYHSVGAHEEQHTYQGQILGPFYIPANIIGGILGLITAPSGQGFINSWHGPGNFMENGPSQQTPRPFK